MTNEDLQKTLLEAAILRLHAAKGTKKTCLRIQSEQVFQELCRRALDHTQKYEAVADWLETAMGDECPSRRSIYGFIRDLLEAFRIELHFHNERRGM